MVFPHSQQPDTTDRCQKGHSASKKYYPSNTQRIPQRYFTEHLLIQTNKEMSVNDICLYVFRKCVDQCQANQPVIVVDCLTDSAGTRR